LVKCGRGITQQASTLLFVTTVSANCATFISDLAFAQVVVIWFPVLLRLQYIQKILQLMHQLWVLLLVTASPLLGNFHRRGTRNMVCTGALLVLQSESEKKGNKLCVCHTVIAEHPWRACLYNYYLGRQQLLRAHMLHPVHEQT
jgi:hypothetical protein